jgi:hypothetical protein
VGNEKRRRKTEAAKYRTKKATLRRAAFIFNRPFIRSGSTALAIGGGGGNRTRVRNELTDRSYMRFP